MKYFLGPWDFKSGKASRFCFTCGEIEYDVEKSINFTESIEWVSKVKELYLALYLYCSFYLTI